MINQDEFYTPKEVAEILKVPVQRIQRWNWQGVIPYVKIQSLIRIKGSDLLRIIEEGEVKGKAIRTKELSEFFSKIKPSDESERKGYDFALREIQKLLSERQVAYTIYLRKAIDDYLVSQEAKTTN
ncbi:helix-turn-helix domain-containing protein [Candidatus Pacearchaeota archaeon]|nr:helix-turn-helix domain-containing protein [Candidatus Pacearchaeota archaeon]